VISALAGGVMIGLAATLLWQRGGRVAGVSGILRGALLARGQRRQLLPFLAGLVAAGMAFAIGRPAPAATTSQPVLVLVLAGLLVGFGTRLSGGCTSGHGVCGISRFSLRSVVATATFLAAGAATVFLVARALPAWSLR
jgi:uncharacterized protein